MSLPCPTLALESAEKIMKRLVTVLCLALAPAAFSGPAAANAPAAADIDRLVALAAKCQSGQSLEPFRQLEELARQSGSRRALREPLETGLVKLLGPDASVEARAFACKQLAVVGSNRSLAALAPLLDHEESAGLACLALTSYPPGKADRMLRNALRFSTGRARIQIINTLGDRRDPEAVAALGLVTRGADRPAAEAAIAALGKIGNGEAEKALKSLKPGVSPLLSDALSEASLQLAEQLLAAGERERAISAFSSLLGPAEPIQVRRGAFTALLPLDKDLGENRILAELRKTNSALKAVAISRIASLPGRGSSGIFASELYHLPPAEQAWLLESLATRADVEARLAISTCLTSPHAEVRRAATAAIGRIGDAWYVPMLGRALVASKSLDETRAIEGALIGLPGGEATDKAITEEISRASGPAGAALMYVLTRRIGPASTPLLLSQLDKGDTAMARFAFRTLGRTAEPDQVGPILSALVALHDPEVRPEAENAVELLLGGLPEASRRSTLVREALGRATTVDSRCSLLGLLPVGPDAPALGALKIAVKDPEPRVREAAIRALGDWPDLLAWDLLAACYRQPERESLRWIAMRGMVRLVDEENSHPGPQFIEHYRQLVAGARNALDLKVILGALTGAAHPDALQMAVSMLSNRAVRPEAELAIKKISEAIKAQHPAIAEEALKKITPLADAPKKAAPAEDAPKTPSALPPKTAPDAK